MNSQNITRYFLICYFLISDFLIQAVMSAMNFISSEKNHGFYCNKLQACTKKSVDREALIRKYSKRADLKMAIMLLHDIFIENGIPGLHKVHGMMKTALRCEKSEIIANCIFAYFDQKYCIFDVQ